MPRGISFGITVKEVWDIIGRDNPDLSKLLNNKNPDKKYGSTQYVRVDETLWNTFKLVSAVNGNSVRDSIEVALINQLKNWLEEGKLPKM